MYTSLEHYIDGAWVKPSGAKTQDVMTPANSKAIGALWHASKGDLDKALAAADKGFKTWKRVSPFERGKILRKAGDLVRIDEEGMDEPQVGRAGRGQDRHPQPPAA